MAITSNFSSYHMVSAVHNARIAGKAEEELNQQGIDGEYRGESLRRWQPIHDAHIITSFTESYAGVETAINEYLNRGNLNEGTLDFIHAYPGDFIYKEGTLDKFQTVLKASGCEPFETGSEPYQSVNLVRKMRNYFVHHDPEPIEVRGEEPATKLGRSLKTKDFELNPFRPSDPFFPGKCLSYSCAAWVFESCMDFMAEFSSRVDGADLFGKRKEWLERELRLDWEELDPNW